MSRYFFLFFCFSFLCACTSDKPTPRVLVFSKTTDFRHASIEAGIKAIKQLGTSNNFEVVPTESASYFSEDRLSNFAAVIFLNTSGDVLNNSQQADFQRFIEAGGGFVGIHGAAASEYDWRWYGRLVGAYFHSHPVVQKAEIKLINPSNPANNQLPAKFSLTDEWYNFRPIPPEGKVWIDAPNTALTSSAIGPIDSLRQLKKHIDPRVAWHYDSNNPFLSPDSVQVLLQLDEKSYNGGLHGAQHPISWLQDYDGGRSFYTGLGHSRTTYANPVFLQHLSNGIQYAVGENNLDYSRSKTQRIPPSDRFIRTTLASNLNEPTELEILPDGRILFLERRGNMKLYDPAVDSVRIITKVPVYDFSEEGFLGLALDPNWKENHWIYLYYSLMEGGRRNRLSRFVFDGRNLHYASEIMMLEVPEINGCCHTGGSIEFDSEGHLFLSTGDNTNPFESDGYSPSDERPGRALWDAQKSSANTNDLRGKILRILPKADGTYTIPKGNLFPEGTPNTRPEIFVMGCRNPYRIGIDQQTGCVYWGDVGPDAGKDGMVRGPKGYDTFNRACEPVNAGWPMVRGNHVYQDYDFATKRPGPHYDPAHPINDSPNNTGLRDLPPVSPPLIWYSYDESTEFPWTNIGGKNPMAGPIFHAQDFQQGTNVFPPYFENKFFAYEWMRDWIYIISLDEDGQYVQADPFLPDEQFNNPMDMAFGPDGALYILEYGESWFTQNTDARLTKIEYAPGNRKPQARMVASKTVGTYPMDVKFSASQSKDYDGDKMSYAWSVNRKLVSTKSNFTHTFKWPSTYEVTLRIKDIHGASSREKMNIFVGNEAPKVDWSISGNQSFYFGERSIPYTVAVNDEEDGSTINETIDPRRLRISIDYLKEGKDVAEIILGHQTAEMSTGGIKYAAGKLAIEKSDCTTCHAEDRKVNGPSYIDIANHYFGNKNAVQQLAAKIIKGGGGVWGETNMAAHPQISQKEAEEIVQYILSLAGEAQVDQSLPTTGVFVAKEHLGRTEKGAYIFQATYSDAGANGIASLSNTSTKVLRHPQIEAESFIESSKGIRKIKDREFDRTLVDGLTDGRYFTIAQIDLTAIKGVQLGFTDQPPKGAVLDIHLHNPNGPVIASGALNNHPNHVPIVPVQDTTGIHNLYFVFRNEINQEQQMGLLDWIKFKVD